jgi:hypothetical protein
VKRFTSGARERVTVPTGIPRQAKTKREVSSAVEADEPPPAGRASRSTEKSTSTSSVCADLKIAARMRDTV